MWSPALGGTSTATVAWPASHSQRIVAGAKFGRRGRAAAFHLPYPPALGSNAAEGIQARRRQPTPATRRARAICGQPWPRVGVEGASLGRAHVDTGCSSPQATAQLIARTMVTDDGVGDGTAGDAGGARVSRHRVVDADDGERACRGEARHTRNGRGTRGVLGNVDGAVGKGSGGANRAGVDGDWREGRARCTQRDGASCPRRAQGWKGRLQRRLLFSSEMQKECL